MGTGRRLGDNAYLPTSASTRRPGTPPSHDRGCEGMLALSSVLTAASTPARIGEPIPALLESQPIGAVYIASAQSAAEHPARGGLNVSQQLDELRKVARPHNGYPFLQMETSLLRIRVSVRGRLQSLCT